jgi:hypothetical protein
MTPSQKPKRSVDQPEGRDRDRHRGGCQPPASGGLLPTRPAGPGGFGCQLVQDLAKDGDVRIGAGGKVISAALPLAHSPRISRPGTT